MGKLSDVKDRLATMDALKNRLSGADSSFNAAEADMAALLREYEEEKRDVERIQKEGFSSFVLKTLGKYEDKLEKEQREEIEAKHAFDRAAKRVSDLKNERDSLSARIGELCREAREYERELEARRTLIKSRLTEPQGMLYLELEDTRNSLIAEGTEIREALNAVSRVKATAEDVMKSLDSAEGWATFDMWSRGGIISHMAKYSHIDDAQELFHHLASQLGDLKSELMDVQGITASGLSEISSTQRIVDFWFDNIFTDISVRSQIRDNKDELVRLLNDIDRIEAALNDKLRGIEHNLEENRRAQEDLLVGLDDSI